MKRKKGRVSDFSQHIRASSSQNESANPGINQGTREYMSQRSKEESESLY